MPFDKWAAKSRVMDDMMSALDGFDADNLGKSQEARKMKETFPGDSLDDALGTHDESQDVVDDSEMDKKNPIKR